MPSISLRQLCAAAVLFGAVQFTAPAQAVLLVYDPFLIGVGGGAYLEGDENANTNLIGGQNPIAAPTAFYAGGWVQSGGDGQAVKDIGSYGYPLFPSAGGRVQETVQFDCCTFGRTGREIAGGLGGGRDARTIYQSFLIDFGGLGADTDPRTDADPNNNGNIGYHGYEMWNGYNGDSPDGEKAVDLYINHFSDTFDLTLAVTTPSGTTSAPLNGGGLTLEALEGVHLVVMKFEFEPAGTDVVTVYLDPTDSIETNWTPAASISVNSSDLFISHHGLFSQFQFTGGAHDTGGIDELRWGDTFADVTPFVPEPTSLALASLGMAGLLLGRRR